MVEHGGILTGYEIIDQISAGNIVIDPFDPKRVQTGSYDLRLGKYVAVYRSTVYFIENGMAVGSAASKEAYARDHVSISGKDMYHEPIGVLDSRKKNEVFQFEMPETGFLLKPGIGYLMHTAERVLAKDAVPVIDGKSSIGRLFVTSHVTAGYGDCGFDGQYTLECVATHPVLVYPGMLFCQMRFHTRAGLGGAYHGHYTGAAAQGPVPSMSYRQFEEDKK